VGEARGGSSVTGVEFAHVEREGWLSARVGPKWAKPEEAAALGMLLGIRNKTSDWLLRSEEADDAQLRAFLVAGVAFSRRAGYEGPPAPDEGELLRRRGFT
jgi:hypothetical protein